MLPFDPHPSHVDAQRAESTPIVMSFFSHTRVAHAVFTCVQLHCYSRRRNATAALAFKNKLRRYTSDQLFFADETSKDGRALRRLEPPVLFARIGGAP